MLKINKKGKINKILGMLVLFCLVFVLSGCGDENQKTEGYNVGSLDMWVVFNDSSSYGMATSVYQEGNPFVEDVQYRKQSDVSYRQDLIEAMILGQAPDIFMIHNTWMPYFKNKLEPVPVSILGEREFRNNFPDVVINDFMDKSEIYGVPLSIDSLALYYNKDIFKANGITQPPETWEEFNEYVEKITEIDEFGNIIQSGAAMGGSDNISRPSDILVLLMMQNGAEMNDPSSKAAKFNKGGEKDGEIINAGENALEYYVQFARSSSPLYTWNSKMHHSVDAFAEGSTAMMLNYLWNYDNVKNKNAKLNFEIAPVPQMDKNNPVNYADYWSFVVRKQDDKLKMHEAWQFLKFLTIKNSGKLILVNGKSGIKKEIPINIDPAKSYLEERNVPAARLDLIEEQKNNYLLEPFAVGNLTARSWYQVDSKKNDVIFTEIINSINRGELTVNDALEIAANRINKLMKDE